MLSFKLNNGMQRLRKE